MVQDSSSPWLLRPGGVGRSLGGYGRRSGRAGPGAVRLVAHDARLPGEAPVEERGPVGAETRGFEVPGDASPQVSGAASLGLVGVPR